MKKGGGRSKGSAGEREMCRWLANNLELDFMPTRNLGQARDSGADIICVKPFIIEVKRCQQLALLDWWIQITKAWTNEYNRSGERVVAFRQNNQPWRFLISATNIKLTKGFIQLEEHVARNWMKSVRYELNY
ncbi:MAG: hypothetical protein R3250_04400 [Melioribacteraceae bacterium]|nr:hypothetical protein [Melioribacteraceae bacterium]